MIDTVKLTLNQGSYFISDKSKFTKDIYNATRGYFAYVQNPTRSELKQGIYKPRLTLANRFNTEGKSGETLSIELSLPKLVFGNNFDELKDSDLSLVIDKLKNALKSMGVEVWERFLTTAPVSVIHYSKNIPLTDGTTPHYLINKIKNANIPLFLDTNQTDYRNEGYSFKWHSNSYEVCFYDKLKDLDAAKISDKRAIENDSAIQFNALQNLNPNTPFEVLRFEVRLNKRQKIKQLLNLLNINSELSFSNLFSQKISQQILLHYLDELECKRLPLFDYIPNNHNSLLAELVINNPNLGIRKAMQLYGLRLAFDSMSPRELRKMFGKFGQRSWYRLISETENIKLPVVKSPLGVIRQHLTKFEPTKLVAFY